jgi:hypothetical protein
MVVSVFGDELDLMSEHLDRKISNNTYVRGGSTKEIEVTFIGGVNITQSRGSNYVMSQALFIKKLNKSFTL